jgi:hypothetical protein
MKEWDEIKNILKNQIIQKQLKLDKEEIAYVPNLGYFNKEGNKVDDICIIQNTSIELLIHSIIHLKTIFKDFNERYNLEIRYS